MIQVSRIEMGTGGLPACARCGSIGAPVFRPAEEVIADVKDLHADHSRGIDLVWLDGTEAFSHPALPVIIAEVVATGAQRVGLETAGALLAAGGNAQGALHAGVRHVDVRYVPGTDTDRASEHDFQLAGIREFVRAAQEVGISVAVSASVPACRHTSADLPAAVAELVAVGVGAVHIKVDPAPGFGPLAVASVIAACDTGVVNAVWVDVAGIELPEGHAMHMTDRHPR